MGRKSAIGSAILVGLLAACYFLYSYIVGFEKESLARKLPSDSYASLSVRHLRKLGLAFATDDQLQSSVQVIQAIGKILEKSIPSFDLPGEDPEIDEALLLELGKHFKTQLTLAALPGESHSSIGYALLSDFYGLESDFKSTLEEITRQASTSSGIELRWISDQWHEIPVQRLNSSLSQIDPDLPDLDLCWAVFQDTLYFCSQKETLEKLLLHAKEAGNESLEDAMAKHDIHSHLQGSPDLTLFINAHPTLSRLADSAQSDLIQAGGMAAGFSPHTFIEALQLNELDSFAIAMTFTGERHAYTGFTYKSPIPILESLHPLESQRIPPPQKTPIYAYEAAGLDAGKALLHLKEAFLKAAPVATFPYIGLRSKIKFDTGIDLESSIGNAFEPEAVFLQTIDFGTGRNLYGDVQEQVVLDYAYRFSLKHGQTLTKLIDSQLPKLQQFIALDFYREDGILYLNGDSDYTLTSDRFALYYKNEYIIFGRGTLKSFHYLLNSSMPSKIETLAPKQNPDVVVGHGGLSAQNLPASLFQLSAVLYQQVNNTPNIPTAFMDFDWASLTALEQRRASSTYHLDGHLFRVSQQLD
ncbi:hypothetical protein QEH56_06520 [Pelagicoccus enzymogenes]|uniref:hypothetical protein n=1 Tax=Pelagicoccus enzymogenes TaxID=2773457 RepID=UPI00280DF34E|nr:hypothetical protein [Pelagicoccus enzymogenes]MDQ8197793.1 hypothetical protein [Pelagicoccus enzymogenes]